MPSFDRLEIIAKRGTCIIARLSYNTLFRLYENVYFLIILTFWPLHKKSHATASCTSVKLYTVHQPKTYVSIFNFMYPFMNDFQNFGAEFISTKLKRIKNPFWMDVFSSYKVFLDSLKPRTWDQFLSQPIWFNSNFKVGGTCMFYRNWYERGIRFVNDLLDENGSLSSYESVIQMFDRRIIFLDFRNVMSNLNVAQCKLNVPFLPFALIEVLRNKKGCRDMYDILVTKTVHSPAIQKWQNNILLPENFKWNDLIPHLRKCTKDTTLIWFEIRIMHRILATNSLLQKMGILLDNRCSFGCGEE